jgi:hypothetical protein
MVAACYSSIAVEDGRKPRKASIRIIDAFFEI